MLQQVSRCSSTKIIHKSEKVFMIFVGWDPIGTHMSMCSKSKAAVVAILLRQKGYLNIFAIGRVIHTLSVAQNEISAKCLILDKGA